MPVLIFPQSRESERGSPFGQLMVGYDRLATFAARKADYIRIQSLSVLYGQAEHGIIPEMKGALQTRSDKG